MDPNLRQTLLFAASLQTFGAGHDLTLLLERGTFSRDPDTRISGELAIASLNEADRDALMQCYELLCGELPPEARAA